VEELLSPEIAVLEKDIQLMRLYNKPELLRSFYNNLKAHNLTSGHIDFRDLLPYDQHHYFGEEALETCIKETGITKNSRVINIGSGLGGPARYLGGVVGCGVLAVELQHDLHRTAEELTHRCDLSHLVHHMAGDFLQVGQHFAPEAYETVVSWLTVLHISDRASLFRLCYKLLKPGGIFYAEDFFDKNKLTPTEKKILRDQVYCAYVPDMQTYLSQLTDSGFEIVQAKDLTEDWVRYTAERVARFDDNKEQLIQIHRVDTFNRLRYFYNVIKELYAAGNLGGARFVARKPA